MRERTIRAEMLLGHEAMEKLENSHVAVFGLGGVGSWCAEALARSGGGAIRGRAHHCRGSHEGSGKPIKRRQTP